MSQSSHFPATSLIRIATRQSALALWQAHYVKARLMKLYPHLQVDLLPVVSQGDQILDIPLNKVGGKGLFVKELEQALLEGHADIAVHSMKDVPMDFPEGLVLACICEREDPRDAFVSNQYTHLNQLPPNAVVGTSSLRRQAQLLRHRPDLRVQFLRGNVNTRLKKLDANEHDAIVLASAGLIRLGYSDRICHPLTIEDALPAAGQGAVGIECCADRSDLLQLLLPMQHAETALCLTAERAITRLLNGGCQVPIGAFAQMDQAQMWLRAMVATPDGQNFLMAEARTTLSCPDSFAEAESLGYGVGQSLLQQGAEKILSQLLTSPLSNTP